MIYGVDLFFSLFNNLAIFIALVGVYGYLSVQLRQSPRYKRQLFLGLAFGMFAVGCMYAKIPVFEGVIVDQRNAIIALSGVFGGPFAAYLSAILAGAFRLYLGGQGAFAGVVGVLLAATAGVLLSKRHSPFGSVARAAASAFIATLIILPGFLFVKDFQTGLALMKSMAAPYGLAVSLGIFTVGLLLHREENKIELEQELGKYRDQLETLVEEQTVKLKKAQVELLQRERLATLGKVTATVSHELRNPLGTIQTALFSIENCLEREDYQQTFRPLELAERSINRCVTIIEELNSYTRVKKLQLSKASIDDWLKVVVAEQIIPQGITCELNLSSDLQASYDQEKLRQVIVNLIANALHALQEKDSEKKHLRISTHLANDRYQIRFEDNGIGMSDDIKEQMFEPLFSTKGFGVGLGMVIVKNIVEQHYGEIDIDSQAGQGTTITLSFPITPPEELSTETA